VYARLGPALKTDSKKIAEWIQKHQETIMSTIEKNGDFFLSDIPDFKSKKKEGLLKAGFIQVKREAGVKGKKDSSIISFNGFYLEIKRK